MAKRPLLPLADYQRIYQVIYSVLQCSGSRRSHKLCLFFAVAGATILRTHYKKRATVSAGCMALMVDDETNVAIYGRWEAGKFVNDLDGYHAWVECDGWVIDFMAPIIGASLREDGHTGFNVPRWMLQRPLEDCVEHPLSIHQKGELFAGNDPELVSTLIDRQSLQFMDLLDVCTTWFRKPPKALVPTGLGGGETTISLVLRAPAIEGAW